MRLKVRLTIQRQVEGLILQQSLVVVFIVRNQQCTECQAEYRQGSWKSLVQVRQRVAHKRTFLYLEQLILKQGAHRGCLDIKTFKDGMDFYFADKGKSARFIAFLESVVPIQTKFSKKLISTDDKNNTANFKYTHYVEICPLCKDDLLYLPASLARQLSNIARLVLVKKISNQITLVDPLTGQIAHLENEVYWRSPIRPLVTAGRARLTPYVVLGKEAVYLRQNIARPKASNKIKTRLAQLTLAREADFGVNDNQVVEQSHVGYLFKAGDACLGYDLTEIQLVDDEASRDNTLPEVVVVRKLYGSSTGPTNKSRKRIWQLQRLNVDVVETKSKKGDTQDMDEEDFMQEVEADKEMRHNINLFKNDAVVNKQGGDDGDEADMDNGDDEDEDGEDDQKVQLDELLDGLQLETGPDAEDVGEADEYDQYLVEGEKAAKDGIAYVSREDARHVQAKDVATPVTSGWGEDFHSKLNQK
jgi:nonsense-mediated mRNA decay protein 3